MNSEDSAKIEQEFSHTDVARLLGVAPRAVCKWIDSGRLIASGPNGGVGLTATVTERDLRAFCDAHGMRPAGLYSVAELEESQMQRMRAELIAVRGDWRQLLAAARKVVAARNSGGEWEALRDAIAELEHIIGPPD